MNWGGPTFTDSGGFQVLSLGSGFRKVLAMDTTRVQADDVIAAGRTAWPGSTTTASPSPHTWTARPTGSPRRCPCRSSISSVRTSSSPSMS